MSAHPHTPDGRYFVVRGRLWRLADPALDAETRTALVGELMAARRAVRAARQDAPALTAARARVDVAKRALGERGPPGGATAHPTSIERCAHHALRRLGRRTALRRVGPGLVQARRTLASARPSRYLPP